MPTVDQVIVDGARFTASYADGFGEVGPVQSSAHFLTGEKTVRLIEATPPGFADSLRERAEAFDDFREVETKEVSTRHGTVLSALVERHTGGLTDPPSVSWLTITLLEGRHGCLHMSGDPRDRDEDIALFERVDVRDDSDGMSVGLEVDTSVRGPHVSFYVHGGGMVVVRPMSAAHVTSLRTLGDPAVTASGMRAYQGDGRSPAIMLAGIHTLVEVIRTRGSEDSG